MQVLVKMFVKMKQFVKPNENSLELVECSFLKSVQIFYA